MGNDYEYFNNKYEEEESEDWFVGTKDYVSPEILKNEDS